MTDGPTHLPGDLVQVVELSYPKTPGRRTLGIYAVPGFPDMHKVRSRDLSAKQVTHFLNEMLVGVAALGDPCLVVAAVRHADGAWYYMLKAPRCLGWTRVADRLKRTPR